MKRILPILLLFYGTRLFSCTCSEMVVGPWIFEPAEISHYVFKAKIIDVFSSTDSMGYHSKDSAEVIVENVWYGEMTKDTLMVHLWGRTSCQLNVNIGQSWVFVVYDVIGTDPCLSGQYTEEQGLLLDELANQSLLGIGRGSFSIYPNPCLETLFVKGIDSFNFKIFNTSGSVVLVDIYQNGIDLTGLEAGLYVLELTYKDELFRHKLIKRSY
ncbi:MAG: T9SS type A sorting domain-containing protein [Cyclobacteriaceae bacterium]